MEEAVQEEEDFPGRLLHQVNVAKFLNFNCFVLLFEQKWYAIHSKCACKIMLQCLFQAALWDNAELLEDLLHGDQLAHINSQDSWGRTPLHAAATNSKSRCLPVLLRAGGKFLVIVYCHKFPAVLLFLFQLLK